jgi:hypothetical protein
MTKSHHRKCFTIFMQFEGSDDRKNEWKKAQELDLLQALKVQIASCLRPESMVHTRVGLVNISHLLGELFCSMQPGQEKSARPRSHTNFERLTRSQKFSSSFFCSCCVTSEA